MDVEFEQDSEREEEEVESEHESWRPDRSGLSRTDETEVGERRSNYNTRGNIQLKIRCIGIRKVKFVIQQTGGYEISTVPGQRSTFTGYGC